MRVVSVHEQPSFLKDGTLMICKLNKVKQEGFYREIHDTDLKRIYAVEKNTNEKWLRDNPEATVIVFEWVLKYYDSDGRRYYEYKYILPVTLKNIDELDVVKVHKNFIAHNDGMIEDTPTYKEKYLKAEEKMRKIKEIIAYLSFDNFSTLFNFLKACYDKFKIIRNIIDDTDTGSEERVFSDKIGYVNDNEYLIYEGINKIYFIGCK